MMTTSSTVKRDTLKWTFALHLMARSALLAINYDKSHIYGIDRVLAVRRGTSRLGGKGQCFTCMICGQKRNLWLEQGKWFVEAYCSVPESRAS